MSTHKNIETVPLRQFTENAYLNYAMYVILDRALPFIGDGLKPVQRRIIYAMSELGLHADAKFKKSARTVGDVLGKYHPHGDSACYQAMVLMAQPFSYRYPLIEGQGNWGSPDDAKSFAAMRYTEARLSPISTSLLSELALGTVDKQPNFDGTLQEPKWLPARLPHILLNGTTGIAVGMATDIPPHNIYEVADAVARLIDDPSADLAAIMAHIPAPDYPTDAEIITPFAELQALYQSGRGSIKMRAVWHQHGKTLVITALPYQVSGAKVLEQIAAQMRAKKLPMVEDLRDESNHETPVRLVIILRTTNVEIEPFINHLLATTDLEKSYRVNLNMLGLDGLPAVKNLLTLLREWLEFRRNTVRRRLQYRLEQVLNRLHLLAGLLVAFLNLDSIIAIIRVEERPAVFLMQQFSLSSSQTEAVLDLKLRHLAKLEEEKIVAEQQQLQREQMQLEELLRCEAQLDQLIKQELLADAKRYGTARRSPLITRTAAKALDARVAVPAEPITVVLSTRGWVRCAKGHEVDPLALSYKNGDAYQAHARGNNHQSVAFFDSSGRSYSLDPLLLPSARGQGELLSSKLNLPPNATIQQVVMADPGQSLLLACDAGYGFVCSFADCIGRTRGGKQLVTLSKNSQLLAPLCLNDPNDLLLAITSVGRLLLFPITQLPRLAKGKGNKIITMSTATDTRGARQRLIHLVVVAATAPAITLHSGKRRMVLKTADIAAFTAKRGDKGALLPRGLQRIDRVS